jgi:signal transduction histidine kinase
VLIVDDDLALLQALSETLQLRMPALSVETTASSPAALDQLTATDYDAIVADIKMPDMDGIELLRRIRDVRPDTPTLLITGHGEHDLAVQALRGGAHDYVQKPIDREYFVGSLSHAIERHRLSRTVAEHKRSLQQHAQELEECLEDRTHELRELYRREAMARAELEKSNAELERARRRRLELVSVIAHELATPLTTLRGYAELLTRPTVGAAVRERARGILLSETSRMARLLQDLTHDVENVEDTGQPSTRVSLQLERCDLAAILRAQVEVASGRSRRHRIVLEAPRRLDGNVDGERIAQVVANLLNNAVKYSPGGEIHVTLQREGRNAHLSVRDLGPGIPPESLDAIFEPGIRLPARRKPDGAGLGLSIAHDIVEAHGGRIWAESEPGAGSTFNVRLPVQRRATRTSRGSAGG